MTRNDALLGAAAEALDDGRDPFSDAFLSEHEVTLDECYTLSEHLALGARLLLRLRAEMGSGSGLVRQVAGTRLAEALLGVDVP